MAKKSAEKKDFASRVRELEKWWKNTDLSHLSYEAAERADPKIEALRIARAKSKGEDGHIVFV